MEGPAILNNITSDSYEKYFQTVLQTIMEPSIVLVVYNSS